MTPKQAPLCSNGVEVYRLNNSLNPTFTSATLLAHSALLASARPSYKHGVRRIEPDDPGELK